MLVCLCYVCSLCSHQIKGLQLSIPTVYIEIYKFCPQIRSLVCQWYAHQMELSAFPPSFIHQVIIITGLNKLQLCVLALKMALDADRA